MTEDFRVIPLSFEKGMYPAGDAALVPAGYARKIRNMVRRPGRWEARPAFIYDGLYDIHSLFIWEDTANKQPRLVAVSRDSWNLSLKATTSETWATVVSADSSLYDMRILDYVNYRGITYYVYQNFAGASFSVRTFNGAAIDTVLFAGYSSATGTSPIQPSCIASFIDRVFFAGTKLVILNELPGAYDPDAAGWALSDATSELITSGSTVLARVTPTSTTIAFLSGGSITLPAGVDSKLVFRSDLRGVDKAYRMPMTLQVYVAIAWAPVTAYAVNDIRVPSTLNNFRYRATVAGTSAAGEPVWPTTLGATVADGTATWINDGPDTIASQDITVPSASDSPDFSAFYTPAMMPGPHNSVTLRVRLKFGNSVTGTITLAPIDFSFRDGKANGAVGKRNYGQQVTLGGYKFPFYNRDDAGVAGSVDISDQILWTDISQPHKAVASDYYKVAEAPGAITTLKATDSRLVAFKRGGMFIFSGQADYYNPLLFEKAFFGIGCLGPRSCRVFRDTLYFIDRHEIYAWKVGGEPTPLCGDAMREEIMNKDAASWVESQATYNLPMLEINEKTQEMWVYTQKGRLYCFDIERGSWSVHECGGGTSLSPVGYEVQSMHWSATNQQMYVSFGTGSQVLARMGTTSYRDALDAVGGTLDMYAEIWPAPIEMMNPRYEICVESAGLHHLVTATQTSQTTGAYVSVDQGVTFPKYCVVTLGPLSTGGKRRIEIPLFQIGESLTLRLVHAGSGGGANWSISALDATVQLLSGEWPKTAPTPSSSSLL